MNVRAVDPEKVSTGRNYAIAMVPVTYPTKMQLKQKLLAFHGKASLPIESVT